MKYTFGNIVVDFEQVEILKDNAPIECEPRVFELLEFFCQRPHQAVTRSELITQVWSGRIVSDAAVNRAVRELRKLIEVDPATPNYLVTVSKVGYRFNVTPSLHNAEPTTHNTNTKTALIANQQWRSAKIGLVICILCIVLVFAVDSFRADARGPDAPLQVDGRAAKTSVKGSAFNPFFAAQSAKLFYLYRANEDDYAQVYQQQRDTQPSALSNDSFYYTDVLATSEGTIYASRLNNLSQRLCEIVEYDTTQQQFRHLLDCGERVVTQLAFDETTRRLLYQFRNSVSEPYAIQAYQIDAGRKQQLTHPHQISSSLGDYAFALSPDDQTLAVVEYNAQNTDVIKLIDLSTNRVTSEHPLFDGVYSVYWRNTKDVFISTSEGLFLFDTDSMDLATIDKSDQYARLTAGEGTDTLLTERSLITANIYQYSLQTEAMQPMTESAGINQLPALANRSNTMAFVTSRTGQKQLFIATENANTFNTRFPEPIDYVSALDWSPDDQFLIASINSSLYRYSVKENDWQRLLPQFKQLHHVAYANETILFSAQVNNQWNIWSLKTMESEPKQLTDAGGYSVQGNNEMIFYTKFNHAGLYKRDLSSGDEMRIVDDFSITNWGRWQLQDNTLYFIDTSTYYALNINTSVKTPMYTFDGRAPASCAINYQNDFFACSKTDLNHSNVWEIKLSKNQ